MGIRRLTEEHVLHVLRLNLHQIHNSTAKGIAFRDFQGQDLVLVGIEGKVILQFCGRIGSYNTFQVNIRPGRTCGVVNCCSFFGKRDGAKGKKHHNGQ